MAFHYLATPYEAYPYGKQNAFHAACKAAAALTNVGVAVYCPIAHFHPIARFMEDRPSEFWVALQQPFMEAARALIVVQLEGWENSNGVARERAAFEKMRKPVHYIGWPALANGCVSSALAFIC